MTPLAEQYVKTVLAVGEHSDGYVDAYYGPEAWQQEVAADVPPLDSIAARTQRLIDEIGAVDVSDASELVQLRKSYLTRQLEAVGAYVSILQGAEMTFDEESQALYGATAPTNDEAHFRTLLDSLDAVLPGTGFVGQCAG